MMQATSRESQKALRERFDEQVASTGSAALRELGGDLAAVAGVLADNRGLARHFADPAAAVTARTGLVDRLFDGKVGAQAVEVLHEAVGQRWSRASDLIASLELLSRLTLLTVAEKENALDETEDELFRFGRLLGTENRLRDLLSDRKVPADRRLELLHGLVDGKASRSTVDLLAQAVQYSRGKHLDQLVEQLAELAAARKQRSVAQVTAAAPLSAEQERRLTQVLSNIYGRTMSVQVDVEPELLGGLVVRVGDEVIDGSIVSRMAKAQHGLPS